MRGLLQDLRYALRYLRKNPGFSAVAIVTLALGIGANTVVLALVQSVLIAPLPYRDAGRIMSVDTHWISEARNSRRLTGPDYVDLRTQATSFEWIAYVYGGEMGVQLPDHAAFTGVEMVSAEFPKVFGVTPVMGRLFGQAEAEHSALVNENFARDNFGSAESAIGRSIGMEGRSYEIVGVLPGSFAYPKGTQVWLGSPTQPGNMNRTAFNYTAAARLKPGVSLHAAQAQLEGIGGRLRAAYPGENKDKSFTVVPMQEQLVGRVRPMFLLLLGAVGLILLIACVNVAHMQLARATTRVREVALRTVLGASRWRVIRQVLLESLTLASIGGVLGVLLANPLLRGFVRLAPKDIPRLDEVHIRLISLLAIAMLAIVATLLSAVAPAWQMLHLNVSESLKQETARGITGRGVSRLRSGLVVAEIALTFVLAAGAGLLVRSMIKLNATDPGYRSDQALIIDAHAPAKTEAEYVQRTQMFQTLFDQLQAVPGVRGVAGVMGLPAGPYGSNGGYQVEGQSLPASLNDLPQANFTLNSPQYFATMGIPLIRGREFTRSDTNNSQPVAIISESMARQGFGNQDPIGKQLRCGLDRDDWMTIVGVVGDVRQDSPASTPGPTLYMPLTQHPFHANEINILVRTQLPPVALMETARQMVKRMDPQVATKFTTMDALLAESTATPRFRSWIVGGFAVLGLLLAMLGIYGVMAYTVAQRTFEVGVRMTFGARSADILGMVLGRAMRLTLAGIVIGLALSMVAARLIASMLFGVTAEDPVSFSIASVILALVALAAAYFPARRAASVNPLTAIRYE